MTIRMSWVSVLFFVAGFSSTLCAERADSIQGLDGALIVVISNGEAATGQVAAELGASGNSLIHVIAGDAQEVRARGMAEEAARRARQEASVLH